MDQRILKAKVNWLSAIANCLILQVRELAEVISELKDKLDIQDASHPKCLISTCNSGIVQGSIFCSLHSDEAHAKNKAALEQPVAHRTDSGSVYCERHKDGIKAKAVKSLVSGADGLSRRHCRCLVCGNIGAPEMEDHACDNDGCSGGFTLCQGQPIVHRTDSGSIRISELELIALESGRAELRDRAATFTLPKGPLELTGIDKRGFDISPEEAS